MKFFFFLLAVAVVTCYVDHTSSAAEIFCSACKCESTTNPSSLRLIRCNSTDMNVINLFDEGITAVNADAFNNNLNMIKL